MTGRDRLRRQKNHIGLNGIQRLNQIKFFRDRGLVEETGACHDQGMDVGDATSTMPLDVVKVNLEKQVRLD